MPQIFSKVGNLVLWVIVSTFFISGTNLDKKSSSAVYNVSDYTIQLTGNLNNSLEGKVDFETTIVTSSKGATFSILKLKLDNKNSFLPHSIEFLISKENVEELPTGIYSVSNNQKGLVYYFEGVALGELPLFAKSGEVQIDYIDESKVKGEIRIRMSNAVGKSIQIEGNFITNK